MKNRMAIWKAIIVEIITVFLIACGNNGNNRPAIIVFHAGSLSGLLKECKQEFEKTYNYNVLLEASGSVDTARKLTDLHKRCDVIALADVELFKSMLYDYCSYTITFASNEMVLMYRSDSEFASALETDWVTALAHYDVKCARSDPLRDPCGYRTLLVWKLASLYYNSPSLEKIFAQRSPKKFMRPKEIDCVALLDTGVCDALWIYKSVALQHGYPYIKLSNHINLSSDRYNEYYKKACISLVDAKKRITYSGSSIRYALSIPKNALNEKGAQQFVKFICSNYGKALIEKNGFVAIKPYTNYWEHLPASLKDVIAQ